MSLGTRDRRYRSLEAWGTGRIRLKTGFGEAGYLGCVGLDVHYRNMQ